MQRLRAKGDRAMRNTPPLYAVYPDYTAPIIRETNGQRVGSLAR